MKKRVTYIVGLVMHKRSNAQALDTQMTLDDLIKLEPDLRSSDLLRYYFNHEQVQHIGVSIYKTGNEYRRQIIAANHTENSTEELVTQFARAIGSNVERTLRRMK